MYIRCSLYRYFHSNEALFKYTVLVRFRHSRLSVRSFPPNVDFSYFNHLLSNIFIIGFLYINIRIDIFCVPFETHVRSQLEAFSRAEHGFAPTTSTTTTTDRLFRYEVVKSKNPDYSLPFLEHAQEDRKPVPTLFFLSSYFTDPEAKNR